MLVNITLHIIVLPQHYYRKMDFCLPLKCIFSLRIFDSPPSVILFSLMELSLRGWCSSLSPLSLSLCLPWFLSTVVLLQLMPQSKYLGGSFWTLTKFFFNLFVIYLLFIFGCVGSSFLCEGFLHLRQVGATPHHDARASHYRGLSCCGAQAPDAQAQ